MTVTRRLRGIPYPEILPANVELPRAGEPIRKGDPVRVLMQTAHEPADERNWRAFVAPAEIGIMHGVALEDAKAGEPLRIQAFVIGRAVSPTVIRIEPALMDEQHLLVIVEE